MEVGQDFSIGIVRLSNLSKKPAMVDRVRLVGVRGPVELIGVRSRPFPDGGPMLGSAVGFPPPKDQSFPLAQAKVVPVSKRTTAAGSPLEGLALVLGVRMPVRGTAAVRGVEVSYHIGKKQYRQVFEHKLWLCAPISEYVGEGKDCPPPEEEDDFGERVLG